MPTYKSIHYGLKKRGDAYQFNVQLGSERLRQQYPTEAAAVAAVEARIDRHLEGMPATPPKAAEFAKPSLQRVYELVRDGRWKGTKGERSARKNAEDCIEFLGGDTPIDKLTTERIDGLILSLKDKGFEPGTVRRKLAALSTLVKHAAERHWITAVPLIDRKSAGKERRRLRFISQEEEDAGLAYLRGYASGKPGVGSVWADLFSVLIDTGLRLSECLNLKWSEVEADKEGTARSIRLGFDNKGEEPRMVPLTDRASVILTARRASRLAGEKRVWPGLTMNGAEWYWGLMRESLGLADEPDFVIHACRHTFASRLAMQGVALNVIKELGGWKTLDMVLRYAHLTPKVKQDAIREMQRWGKDGTHG